MQVRGLGQNQQQSTWQCWVSTRLHLCKGILATQPDTHCLACANIHTCQALSCLQGLSHIGSQVIASSGQHVSTLGQLHNVPVGGLPHLSNAQLRLHLLTCQVLLQLQLRHLGPLQLPCELQGESVSVSMSVCDKIIDLLSCPVAFQPQLRYSALSSCLVNCKVSQP